MFILKDFQMDFREMIENIHSKRAEQILLGSF